MNLAEALQERADLDRKISQLNVRLSKTVLVQQGEKPAEDPNVLLGEVRDCTDRLETLIRQINLTNCQYMVDGISLTAIIAKKDMLLRKLNVFRNALDNALQSTNRARGTEIKIVPAIDVGILRKEADEIAKQIRLLDNKLQQANWSAELIED